MLRPIAFLFISPGASPDKCSICCTTDIHEMYLVGCDNIDAACEKAVELADKGIQLLELCGGFHAEGCRRVIEAVQGRIPVGYVDFFPEEQEKLERQHTQKAGSQA